MLEVRIWDILAATKGQVACTIKAIRDAITGKWALSYPA